MRWGFFRKPAQVLSAKFLELFSAIIHTQCFVWIYPSAWQRRVAKRFLTTKEFLTITTSFNQASGHFSKESTQRKACSERRKNKNKWITIKGRVTSQLHNSFDITHHVGCNWPGCGNLLGREETRKFTVRWSELHLSFKYGSIIVAAYGVMSWRNCICKISANYRLIYIYFSYSTVPATIFYIIKCRSFTP